MRESPTLDSHAVAHGRGVLVAPDSFKGTFTAPEVAAAIARGLLSGGVGVDVCPVADGGEGTLAALCGPLGLETASATVSDPLGRPANAQFGVSAGGVAVVEVAAASGIGLVADVPLEPERASTRGTGELIAAAIEAGATTVYVAIGGSATTDGGAGAIEALRQVGGLGNARLVLVCDVNTRFEDAARVFGPQKGADAASVERLSERLDQQADDLAARTGRDPRGVVMSGGAGGLAGGLWAAFCAELVPGAQFVLDAVRYDARATASQAVITGEGRLDGQSISGKLVSQTAARAGRLGIPCHAIVGSSTLAPADVRALGLHCVLEATTLGEIEDAALSIIVALSRH